MKKEGPQINHLSFYYKELEQGKEIKPQAKRRNKE